jgi:predicted KAP-like P-loop ATPase
MILLNQILCRNDLIEKYSIKKHLKKYFNRMKTNKSKVQNLFILIKIFFKTLFAKYLNRHSMIIMKEQYRKKVGVWVTFYFFKTEKIKSH